MSIARWRKLVQQICQTEEQPNDNPSQRQVHFFLKLHWDLSSDSARVEFSVDLVPFLCRSILLVSCSSRSSTLLVQLVPAGGCTHVP